MANMLNLSKKSPEIAKYLDKKYLEKEKSKLPNLSPKHQLFCDNLLQGKNQAESAILAGYKDNENVKITAVKILRREDVKEYLRIKQKKAGEKAEMTREKGLLILKKIAENEEIAPRDRISSLQTIAKWQVWEAPEKVQEVTIPPIKIVKNYIINKQNKE